MIDDPLIGRQLANFLVERVLGRGGMAQVYYGQDVKLQRPVAIKVIDARYRSKPAYAQRFVKEARSVAKWRHENIIHIYYADDQDDLYYYVMEYIDGPDLASVMSGYTTEGEFMPSAEILRIGRALAGALDFAHSKGIIHRDVKPSNVMMSSDGRVVLGDFGLALDMQEGSSGEVFGTPHYISPEQARYSKDVVPQSDLYSLGVILYEMLTGVVPFDDASPTSVALQHITQPPPSPRSINPQLNIETEEVLLKALGKTPEERYQSGAALMDALEQALSQHNPSQKVLPLPPIPAAIISGQAATVFQTPTGSLVETQLQAPKQEAHPAAPVDVDIPGQPIQTSHRKKRGGFLPVMGLLGLLIFLVIGGSLWIDPLMFRAAMGFFSSPDPTGTITASPQPTQTAIAKTEAVLAPTTRPSLTASATPAANAVTATDSTAEPPTETLTASPSPATPTLTATETLIVNEAATGEPPSSPTGTGTPPAPIDLSTPSPTPTFGASPTVQHPNGKRFLVFYDEDGLYLINASDEKRPLEPFAFERLDEADTPLNRFDGFRWSQFYPTIYPETCIKIEVPKRAEYPARPAQCENRYVGARFYERESPSVFWTAQAGSSQFRILWEDNEVARCEIERGACEVFIP